MAHLHGDRAYGHGAGTSHQNLITGLDRDSADSSSSTEVAGGTTRTSTGSDLEPFDENPVLETRLRESQIAPPLPELEAGLENAPPVSTPAQHPISAPLNFEGIVANKDTLDAAATRRGNLRVLRTSNDSPVDPPRGSSGDRVRCQCFRLPGRRRNTYYDSDGEEIPEPEKV